MSFPKNRVCVTLCDFQCSLNVAEQIYLPLEVRPKLCKLLGNSNKKQNIFLRMNELPICVLKHILPSPTLKRGKLNWDRLFLLSAALGDEKILEAIDESNLVLCCKKRNIIKWIKFIKKTEPWSLNPGNYKLLLLCGLILSNCISETLFKHQMRLI